MFHCLCRAENEKSLSSDPSSTDVKSFFSNCNVAALRQLGGGRVLLDLCLSLPEFSKIASKPESSGTLISLTSLRCVLNLQHSKLQSIQKFFGCYIFKFSAKVTRAQLFKGRLVLTQG